MNNRRTTLFKLIITIVAVTIAGILLMVILNAIGLKARDLARKNDLHQISVALELYHASHGTYVVGGSGSDGMGNGWFSYTGGDYPKSVARGLVDDGDLNSEIVDPTGARVGNSPLGHSGYAIVATPTHYTLWADLENPSAADRATLDSCDSSTYDLYPPLPTPTSAELNYCISH